MRVRRRTNLLWGLALLAVAVVVTLKALDIIPASIFDLLARAWPALLVLAGLSIILRTRVPLGSLLALIVTVALAGGVTAYAFSARATQQREDYQEPVLQNIGPNVTLLRVQIRTLATDVELLRRVGADRVVSGQFTGSPESKVEVTYNETDVAAELIVTEQQVNQFPMLETMGRGVLRLELPPDLPVDIELLGTDGAVTLNMNGLAVERMNLDLQRGNALVTLPVYDPLGSGPGDSLGTLAVREGDITLFIDPQVAARLELNRSGSGINPVFDANIYNYLVGDVLEARSIETAEIVMRYTITAPRGLITVREPLQ
jgi:hypothetical protein